MSADDLLNQKDGVKQFTEILSAQNTTSEDVDDSQVYSNSPNATNAAETLNGEVECVETVPDHMALELGNILKSNGGDEPDGKPPKPDTPFTKVRSFN